MGPKKKEPTGDKGDIKGGQEGKGGKGGKGKQEDLPSPGDEISPVEEQLPPGELFCPPEIVTPEFTYNKDLSLEQLQDIYALSGNLEDAARHLAVILGTEDCVFDARNLILLEYCLGNLMFAKQAGLTLTQSLEIYDMGHMVLDLIRAGAPFGDAEVLFKNRLLSHSLLKYKEVAPDPTGKENDQPKESDQPKGNDQLKDDVEPKDSKKQKETKKPKDIEKPKETKESKKSKKAKNSIEPDKLVEPKPEEPQYDDKQDEPLFSRLDVKKITPYFVTTVFQHYCLYQYCFTKVHYNIRRTETVFVQTALTYPLSEAKSEEQVKADEIARVAAEEKARQDAYAAQWWAEQSVLDSIMAEARRLAEEELARKSLTLDEYIERAVRYRIEEAKKELVEEYEYREHFLIDKILQRQKEQAADAAPAAAALNAKAAATEKAPPVASAAAVADKKTKKGK